MLHNLEPLRFLLSVTKTYAQEYVCYQIRNQFPTQQYYNLYNAAWDINTAKNLYYFAFNSTLFSNIQISKPFVGHNNKLSPNTQAIAEFFVAKFRTMFSLTFSIVKTLRLKHPFRTNCRIYKAPNFNGSSQCRQVCSKNLTITHFNKIPHRAIETERLKLKHISPLDQQNATTFQTLAKFEEICQKLCSQPDCEESIHYSQVY